MAPLSPCLKEKIIVLWAGKISISEIARRLQLTRTTVQLWVRRYAKTGEVKRFRPGPPPASFVDNNLSLHRSIIAKHTFDPSATTRATATELGVSLRTVRMHLKHANLFNCMPCKPGKKIILSDQHKQHRINFAREYLNFDWERNVVIFTDEKYFMSDKDGKILWRRPRERRYSSMNILPNRASSRIRLGYWGWMSSMGPGELVEIGGRMSDDKYLEILRDVMLPTVRVAYPQDRIYFVQDNWTVHRSRIVKNWLNAQHDITLLPWPSKSPDLNPIENFWDQIILNCDVTDVRNKENLHELVTGTWENMRGSDICNHIIAGMREQLEEVIDKEGNLLFFSPSDNL